MIDVTKPLLNYLSKMTNFVYFTSLSKVGMFEMTLIIFLLVKMDTTSYTCHFYACGVYVDVNMMINISHYCLALWQVTCNIYYILIMGNATFIIQCA
jgi:hypothetical protein